MKVSQLFTKTSKNSPAGEVSKNAKLLIRAGYVHKEMAGVYTFLPLGLRVLDNICNIVRDEMNAIGAQEMKLTTLQDAEIWKATDRWDDDKVDVWFKTKLKNQTELGLGPTHEEPLVRAVKPFVSSYHDLPFMAYQIQTKFRNEVRAKSGIMRGREFLMKDLYSFTRSQEEHEIIYERVKEAYFRVFERLGIGDKTFLTFASGGMFSKYSHEFQTVTDAGEDIVYLDEEKKIAVNEEVNNKEVLDSLGLKAENLKAVKTAEVGNIFTLKDKFSKPLGLNFTDENGDLNNVQMGCYGIGPSRLMGVIAELMSDNRGLIWPTSVAPYQVYLVQLGQSEKVLAEAGRLYQALGDSDISVLLDDRDVSAGAKLADADLLGMPFRIVISDRSIDNGGAEFKKRNSEEVNIMSSDKIISQIEAELQGE